MEHRAEMILMGNWNICDMKIPIGTKKCWPEINVWKKSVVWTPPIAFILFLHCQNILTSKTFWQKLKVKHTEIFQFLIAIRYVSAWCSTFLICYDCLIHNHYISIRTSIHKSERTTRKDWRFLITICSTDSTNEN